MVFYVEFHARSAYSFLEGAASPESLVDACASLKMPAMALLDRNGLYGAPKFFMAARRAGIRPHVGAEVALQDGSYCPMLAQKRKGYQNLVRLITRIKMRAEKGEGAATYEELAEHSDGLICLTGGDDGPLARALSSGNKEGGFTRVNALIGIFGRDNVYVELQRHYNRMEECRNQAAIDIARTLELPVIATNGVCYSTPETRELLDAFTCIKNHARLATAGRLPPSNLRPFRNIARPEGKPFL